MITIFRDLDFLVNKLGIEVRYVDLFSQTFEDQLQNLIASK